MTLSERIVESLRQRRQCAQHIAEAVGEPLDNIWPALVRLADQGAAYPLTRKCRVHGVGRARMWCAA